MEAQPGLFWISIECLCDPPRMLTADAETPVVRCEECDVEILVDGPTMKRPLRLVTPT